MQRAVFFLVILIASFGDVSSARAYGWDGLLVRKNGSLIELPTTVSDALNEDHPFVLINECNLTAPWRGRRYIQNSDRSLALLYDRNGYIAGIQISIPKNLSSGYPSATVQPLLLSDGDFWVATAYFVHPNTICTGARNNHDYNQYGTGGSLYIQNTASPEEAVVIPLRETNLASTRWTRGRCAAFMGTHYWFDLSSYSECDNLAPWFLMYNEGSLTGVGFVFATNLTGTIFEKPTRNSYQLYMDTVPNCLLTDGVISIVRVFFKENVRELTCNATSTTGG